jgi:hypothetical protein
MQKAKPVAKPVAVPSPGDKLVALLRQWKQTVLSEAEKRRARASSVRDSTSDRAWQKLAERRAALRALTELASESTRTACLGAGLLPIVELVATQPIPPIPHRPLDQVEPTTWMLRLRPTDPSPIRHEADDPLSFLALLLESVVPAWIECLAAPLAPANAAPPSLDKKAIAVLKLLYGDKAFDEEHPCNLKARAPTALVRWPEATAETRVQYARDGCKQLRAFGLVNATPNIGTWLTPEGKAEAQRRFGSTANK